MMGGLHAENKSIFEKGELALVKAWSPVVDRIFKDIVKGTREILKDRER